MTADPVGALIQEIAGRHGIAVGRDDPIMVMHTVNERLLRNNARAQDALVASLREELEALAHRWDKEAKTKAERILNASLKASKEAMAAGAEQSAQAVARAVRQELEGARALLDGPARELRRAARVNLAAAALTVLASGLALWACRIAVG